MTECVGKAEGYSGYSCQKTPAVINTVIKVKVRPFTDKKAVIIVIIISNNTQRGDCDHVCLMIWIESCYLCLLTELFTMFGFYSVVLSVNFCNK